MSPILTRPVREQLEHDRVIRLLQARYKKKHEVVMNPGAEQNQSVTVGALSVFPDLLLFSGKRLEGTVEVETGESVNQLEALAEWGVFSKLKVPLHLYVPPGSVDTTRRLCTELQIPVAEIWTFHLQFDQARFTMVYRAPDAAIPKSRPAAPEKVEKPKPAPKAPAAKAAPKAKPSASAKATADKAKKAKPAAKAKPVAKKAKPAAKKAPAKKSAKPGKRR